MQKSLKTWLDEKVFEFNRPEFIVDDPICVPHRFTKKQDIEIAGFFTAVLAWGQRKTIIAKSLELMSLMDNEPHSFMLNHGNKDLKNMQFFKHRTFNITDLLYFISFLKLHFEKHESLETAFSNGLRTGDASVKNALIHFHEKFFSLSWVPARTKKHIATPARKSACKRLNMFLRWMLRNDDAGVDFGLWKNIKPRQLLCPLDVHVEKVARSLGLLTRKQTDFQAVEQLTNELRQFDSNDPVKYDFALFGTGLLENRVATVGG